MQTVCVNKENIFEFIENLYTNIVL